MWLYLIIGINVLFTWQGLNDASFFQKNLFNVGAVKRGEYYRLITSGFLHAGWGHLLMNMITLYFFFPVVQNYLGTHAALAIYLGGLAGGNALAYYFHRYDDWYSAVGASGAVNAVVFSSIMLFPSMTIFMPFPVPAWLYAIGYLLYSTFGMDRQQGNTGHEAHFGGAAVGLFLTLSVKPELFQLHPVLSIILIAVLIGGFGYVRSKKY